MTGADGFLGNALLKTLAGENYSICAIYRRGPIPTLRKEKNVVWHKIDLAKQGLDQELVHDADFIIHCAGYWRGTSEHECFMSNELATFNLTKSLENTHCKLVFCSSQMVYGDPGNLNVAENLEPKPEYSSYSCSKINAENWLRYFQKKTSGTFFVLRLTGFVEGGGFVSYVYDQAIENKGIQLFGDGSTLRDYLSLSCGVEAIRLVITKKSDPGYYVYNIGSGSAFPARELASRICETIGSKSQITFCKKKPPRSNFCFDISRAKKELGFNPLTSLEAALRYVRSRQGHHIK